MSNQYKDEVQHRGQALGCPIAPAYSAEDLLNSEHLKERDFFVAIDHPKTGKIMYPSAPYRFSETPWAVERPAPLLGQHNEEVYCGRLGYSKEDLTKMREAGTI